MSAIHTVQYLEAALGEKPNVWGRQDCDFGRGDGTLFEPLGRVRDKCPGGYPGLHARQHVIDACDCSLRRLNHPDQPVGAGFARD